MMNSKAFVNSVKSVRSLTKLLGKLGVQKLKRSWWIQEYDEFGNVGNVIEEISYGWGLKESKDWTERYLATIKARSAVTTTGGIGVNEDKSSSL